MSTSRWLGTLGVIALLAAACGSSNPPAGNAASASRTSPTSATPVPPGISLALVTLRGSSSYVVRDISNIAHATTVSTLGTNLSPQFVSATSVTYFEKAAVDDPASLFRMPLSGSPKTLVLKVDQGFIAAAWSPDGSTVVYLVATDSEMTLHQLTSGHDRVLGSMPPLPNGFGCEVEPCPAALVNIADRWDFRLTYSPDGAFVSVVHNSISSLFRLWTSDGRLLKNSDSDFVTMSVWSGGSLYFRDGKGVEVWRGGVVSTFLPGVAWIRPKASPVAGQIVYEARDARGSAHVYLVDTATRKVRDLRTARVDPVFLTFRYIWYQDEPACVAAGKCEPSFPGIATGKTYIYDLQDGTETGSIITSVADVWPHAA